MFSLTKKTDYGIIALTHMAQQGAGIVCTAREIAERYHVPPALLVNVLKALCQSELVRSTRGAKGGYTVARPASEITLASIIRAIEGPVRFVQCSVDSTDGESPCELIKSCPVTRPARKVHERLMRFLSQVTLDQIAFDHDFKNSGVVLSHEGAALQTESIP